MDLEKLLAAIQKRPAHLTGRGIGLASHYVKSVEFAVGSKRSYELFAKSRDSWLQTLKDVEKKLVFRSQDMDVLGGTILADGSPVKFGNFKDLGGATPKSAMDFGCVLTSVKKDRDRDVLEPKGAKIDPRMPLLFQHMPSEPVGKFIKLLGQDDNLVTVHGAIVDTPMGRDMATMVEFGCLRISHGFVPTDYAPLDEDSEEWAGWHIRAYDIMEFSLVTIPSNTDAIITVYDRGKLHCPAVKSWASYFCDSRPALVRGADLLQTKGQDVNVTVHIHQEKSVDKPLEAKTVPEPTPPVVTPPAPATLPAAAPPVPAKKDDETAPGDAPPPKPPEKPADKPADDKPKEDEDEDEKSLLAEIIGDLEKVVSDEGVPQELRDRCQVACNMLKKVAEHVKGYMDSMSACSDEQDIAGMAEAHEAMKGAICGTLSSAHDEMQRAVQVQEIKEPHVQMLRKHCSSIKGMLKAFGHEEEPQDDYDPPQDGQGGQDMSSEVGQQNCLAIERLAQKLTGRLIACGDEKIAAEGLDVLYHVLGEAVAKKLLPCP